MKPQSTELRKSGHVFIVMPTLEIMLLSCKNRKEQADIANMEYSNFIMHCKMRTDIRLDTYARCASTFDMDVLLVHFPKGIIDSLVKSDPHESMRFLYGGDKMNDYVFGFEQLPNKGDIIFITGGEKDVMTLAARKYNAISFNSETAQIPESLIESLQLRFRHIILLYDTDETGIREANRQMELLSKYKLLNLVLPLSGKKNEKDISDYFALNNSEQDFKKFILILLMFPKFLK